MRFKTFRFSLIFVALVGTSVLAQTDRPKTGGESQRRALSFLSREVPRWFGKNKCYSCHNNGDGARALFEAVRAGIEIDREAVAHTTRWLSQPDRWKDNGGERKYGDKKLASIQFASSLLSATEAGIVKQKGPLIRSAEIVAGSQGEDGSWTIDAQGSIGSPVTYGSFLATAISVRILTAADRDRFKNKIAKADTWLRERKPKNVLDAAATLLGLEKSEDLAASAQRRHCLELVRKGQHNNSGGWGPYITSAAEPFDTAVVLLALSALDTNDELQRMIKGGCRYLVETQLDDGSWQETTRPAGAESYAQHISTTAWATIALMATSDEARGRPTKKPASH